jgi:hypothetical protein
MTTQVIPQKRTFFSLRQDYQDYQDILLPFRLPAIASRSGKAGGEERQKAYSLIEGTAVLKHAKRRDNTVRKLAPQATKP